MEHLMLHNAPLTKAKIERNCQPMLQASTGASRKIFDAPDAPGSIVENHWSIVEHEGALWSIVEHHWSIWSITGASPEHLEHQNNRCLEHL
jgi:hypothetical protein